MEGTLWNTRKIWRELNSSGDVERFGGKMKDTDRRRERGMVGAHIQQHPPCHF